MPPDSDGHIAAEVLAAWLDSRNDFTSAERQRIDAHLGACPACQATLAELRAIVSGLRALPQVAPPRSFTLTPALAAGADQPPAALVGERARAPVVLHESRPWIDRQIRLLRYATAAAVVLFMLVVSIDVLSRIGGGTNGDRALDTTSAPPAAATSAGAAAEQRAMEPTEAAAAGAAPASTPETMAAMMEATPTPAPAAGAAEPTTAPAPAADAGAATPAAEDTALTAMSPDESTAAVADTFDSDETATRQAQEQPALVQDADDGDSRESLRLIEVGLALLVVWLLAAMIAIPRLGRREK
jgi:hypothetical protein